jgi:hypothetical protein
MRLQRPDQLVECASGMSDCVDGVQNGSEG